MDVHLSDGGSRNRYISSVLTNTGPNNPTFHPIHLLPPKFNARDDGRNNGRQSPGSWGFPFHSSCWEILLSLARQDQQDQHHNVQVLFDICRSSPNQDGIINFSHSYGGPDIHDPYAAAPTDDERHMIQGPDGGTYPGCPLKTLAAVRSIFDIENLPSHATVLRSCYPITRPDVFSKFPPEILHLMLELLPSRGIIRVKQASKSFANTTLHESFWRSRFLPSREFGMIFEVWKHTGSLRGKWQSLYHRMKDRLKYLRTNNVTLANCSRTWRLASSLHDLMDIAGGPERLQGDAARLLTRGWCPMHTDVGRRERFREIYYRSLINPCEKVLVYVSVVDLHGRRYISSIRLGESTLGYQRANEALITPAPVEVHAFHITQDQRGVRGLAVSSRDRVLSSWAGDHEGNDLLDLSDESQDSAEKPQDSAEESQDLSEESQDSSEESQDSDTESCSPHGIRGSWGCRACGRDSDEEYEDRVWYLRGAFDVSPICSHTTTGLADIPSRHLT